jgi:maltose alpha-D-glucosyltransferase / alpha-amylase
MSLRMEDRLPIVDILEQTPPIPETAPMGAVPAQPRRADPRNGHRRGARLHVSHVCARASGAAESGHPPPPRAAAGQRPQSIELLNALLLSLPGTPVLYYGDEIGMGENIYLGDRNGVRTPMQWSSDKNAGFSRANPQSLYLPIILDPAYHYEACNVEVQAGQSAFAALVDAPAARLAQALARARRGKCEFLQPDNHKILSYVLRHEKETILVVANLSRFTQPVELDVCLRIPFKRMKFPSSLALAA